MTQENVRNSQTVSKELFRRCIQEYFQSMNLRKYSKQAEKLQGIFSNVYS